MGNHMKILTRMLAMCSIVAFWQLALVSSTTAETCVTTECHPDLARFAQPHQPVKAGNCLACHVKKSTQHPVSGGKSFGLIANDGELCKSCHTSIGTMRFIHGPLKGGVCLKCHNPHGGAARYLMDNSDQTSLCLGCHASFDMKKHYLHGPVAAGSCTSCHNPHEGTSKPLLKGNIRDVCLGCHRDFAKAMKEAGIVHPPVKDDPCTSCHDPHGSPVQYILKDKLPNLCLGCHDSMQKKIANVKVPHKPLQQSQSCINCHSAHFSAVNGLLPTDQKGLCLGCHSADGMKSSRVLKNFSAARLKNMKNILTGKKNLHGPINQGQCTGCHNPHGSDTTNILNGAYPADFYAPYKEGGYDLCLSCHDKSLLKYAETSIYTKFRNGKQNLHFVHVSNKRKGRSCRACHEPHAANGPKMISKDGAQFGDWKVPIRFIPSDTGGSCSPGCHRSYRYDREIQVRYSSTK